MGTCNSSLTEHTVTRSPLLNNVPRYTPQMTISSSLNEDVVLSRRPQLSTFGDINGVLSSSLGGLCIYSGNSSCSGGSSGNFTSLLFVCDTGNHRVVAIDATSGAFIRTVYGDGSQGSGPNQLCHPEGICLLAPPKTSDSNNSSSDEYPLIFIADAGNDRVQVVNCGTGVLAGSFGGFKECDIDDRLEKPLAVCIGPSTSNSSSDPLLYVADMGNKRVQVLNAYTLEYIRTIGTGKLSDDLRGICVGGAILPSDSSSSFDYSIFVSDKTQMQILEFSAASGSFIKSIEIVNRRGNGSNDYSCSFGIYYLPAGAGLKNVDPLLYVAGIGEVEILNAITGAYVRHIDVGYWCAYAIPAVSIDGDSFLYASCWNDDFSKSKGYLKIISENYILESSGCSTC